MYVGKSCIIKANIGVITNILKEKFAVNSGRRINDNRTDDTRNIWVKKYI